MISPCRLPGYCPCWQEDPTTALPIKPQNWSAKLLTDHLSCSASQWEPIPTLPLKKASGSIQRFKYKKGGKWRYQKWYLWCLPKDQQLLPHIKQYPKWSPCFLTRCFYMCCAVAACENYRRGMQWINERIDSKLMYGLLALLGVSGC